MTESPAEPGSRKTLKSWVTLYSDSLYSWALHKTSSREIAEDLVQETFLAALQAFEKFQNKSHPKTWLFAILNNKIHDFYRKNFRNPVSRETDNISEIFDDSGQWKKEERPQSWQVDEGHLLDDVTFRETLQQCMDKLPEKWYSTIRLRYLKQKSGEEVCQELGITSTNLWQILHRTKLQLRKCLEQNWFKK